MNTKNGYCLTEEEADPAKLNVADLIDLFFQQYFYILGCFLRSLLVLRRSTARAV